MVFTYVNPAVAVAAGVLVLAEPLTPSILAGFALIMAGSLLAAGVRRRAGRQTLARHDGQDPGPSSVRSPRAAAARRTPRRSRVR